jgi:hypothetical protein
MWFPTNKPVTGHVATGTNQLNNNTTAAPTAAAML